MVSRDWICFSGCAIVVNNKLYHDLSRNPAWSGLFGVISRIFSRSDRVATENSVAVARPIVGPKFFASAEAPASAGDQSDQELKDTRLIQVIGLINGRSSDRPFLRVFGEKLTLFFQIEPVSAGNG
ncbi:hypothetical protein [Larkinella rosea]|uniref:Uncharacterized protein n=1 Tax=Larkinella rosea TaxID=2025312 RepID=A0A3P1BN34_9BACT|nr:hypothetical protein [Larkinella rosea]RRB02550.1 hypothetical protein EHT25_19035 [Larkinella rosea]